jgi:hypothetical protein
MGKPGCGLATFVVRVCFFLDAGDAGFEAVVFLEFMSFLHSVGHFDEL